MFDIGMFCSASFRGVLITGNSYSDHPLVKMTSINIKSEFADSSFVNSTGGIHITKFDSGFLESYFRVDIQSCTFTTIQNGAQEEQ